MRTSASFLVGLGLAALVGATSVVVTATPAAAHGTGGLQPTDYETVVHGVVPPLAGVTVRSVDLGSKLELRNEGRPDVVVLGYDGEPYLRVGARGVFENARSPAVFLNRSATPNRAVPRAYDAHAQPRWQRISTSAVARWHDHRAHWMNSDPPPAVTRDPNRTHVVLRDWKIPLRIGAASAEVRGDARWVPGPATWPWLLGAIASATGVVALGRTRRWPQVVATALALLIASEVLHLAGAWGATTAGDASRLGAGVYAIAGCVVGVVALVWLARREPLDATPVVLIAGLFLFIAGGLADVVSLTRSQLPTTLPDWLARACVSAALGLGAGVMITAGMRLRPPQRTFARAQPRDSVVVPSR